jgi:non-canonical (house-cleaning) NTP pyrophosphatase
MVTGTVIPIGDHNAGGGIWVTLYLLDNSGKQLGSLNTYLREDGFVPVNSDTAFSTPAPWTVGGGPQQFTFDIASMIKADLTGVNAADVAEITVQLEDYLGYQGVFSNISVVSTQAPPTDISVSVPSVSPTDPLAGTNVTFGADMHTFALTDTPDVKLQIGVPAGLGYVSCQASSASSSGAGVVSAPCAFDSSTGQVTASFDTLGVGREGTLSVVASIPSSTAGGTSLMVTDHVAAANNRNALTSSSTVFKVGIDSGVIDPGQGDGQPPVGATPELDSLLLLGSGASGMGAYALMRLRAARRRRD